jgi:hypothetical protein
MMNTVDRWEDPESLWADLVLLDRARVADELTEAGRRRYMSVLEQLSVVTDSTLAETIATLRRRVDPLSELEASEDELVDAR